MPTKQEKETVTIRIDPKTKSAIDALAAILAAKTGGKVKQSDAIWYAISKAEPDIVRLMEDFGISDELQESDSDPDEK